MPRIKTEVIPDRLTFDKKAGEVAKRQTQIAVTRALGKQKALALITEYESRAKALEADQKSDMKSCMAYAKLHWSEMADNNRRSIDIPGATVGFRTDNPSVSKDVDGTEEQVAIDLFKQGHSEVVTVKYSLDKSAIMKLLQSGCEWLKELFHVEQGETFYIEAKPDKTAEE